MCNLFWKPLHLPSADCLQKHWRDTNEHFSSSSSSALAGNEQIWKPREEADFPGDLYLFLSIEETGAVYTLKCSPKLSFQASPAASPIQ